MVLQFTVPTKGSHNKGKLYCIFFNPVINEAFRRVNNGYSFYDKIKPILLHINGGAHVNFHNTAVKVL